MAIPGLSAALPGLSATIAGQSPSTSVATTRSYDLTPGSEYRFESSFTDPLTIRLMQGTCELFGTELALQVPYTFRGTKAAIYSWHGCKLEVSSTSSDSSEGYVYTETPMVEHANVHFALEDLRKDAAAQGVKGPRVLVVGPQNSGKTALCKLLAAYADKVDRQPMVVNLDTREGMLSVPGSLSAAAFASIMDVELGWGTIPMSEPAQVPAKMPLVYFFGHEEPKEKSTLYKELVSKLGLAVVGRAEKDMNVYHSGFIIDTPGSISSPDGYDHIRHIVSEFDVNIVLVLGAERLYADMARTFPSLTVIKLQKSGGCVDRTEEYMRDLRKAQIRSYFYGTGQNILSPHNQTMSFDELSIYNYLEGGYGKVEPSPELTNSILAISQVRPDAPESINEESALGFAYVHEVDMAKKTMRILKPVSGNLPSKALVVGNVQTLLD